MNIAVTGSLSFDYIFNYPGKFSDQILADKIHSINISFIVDKYEKRYGGTAGNISYNLSLLKTSPILIAAVGNDFRDYRRWLIKKEVNVDHVKIYSRANTALGFAMTDLADNQIWSYCYGALKNSAKISLKQIKRPVDMLIISANHLNAFKHFTDEAIELKMPYMYDFGMILTMLGKKDLLFGLEHADIVIANDYEVAMMLKKTNLTKKEILKKVKILITTLGEKGSVIETKNQSYRIRVAKPTKVIDPTGAGDAYRAGFMAGFVRNFDLKTCGQMGAVAAVYTVEKYGTTTHQFTMKEFCDRYKKNFKEKLVLNKL